MQFGDRRPVRDSALISLCVWQGRRRRSARPFCAEHAYDRPQSISSSSVRKAGKEAEQVLRGIRPPPALNFVALIPISRQYTSECIVHSRRYWKSTESQDRHDPRWLLPAY